MISFLSHPNVFMESYFRSDFAPIFFMVYETVGITPNSQEKQPIKKSCQAKKAKPKPSCAFRS